MPKQDPLVRKDSTRMIEFVTTEVIDESRTLGVTTVTQILPPYQQDVDESVACLRLKITNGITDDPIDERILYVFTWFSTDNLPQNRAAMLDGSLWASEQRWRVIGDGAGTIELIEDHTIEFDPDVNRQAMRRLGGTNPNDLTQALGVLVRASTSSTVAVTAIFDLEHIWIQRSFRDDPMDWADYEFEETVEQ